MIGWALETFVATSLLMLLVLALRAPVRKSFGPHMAYALWLLPVARLLLPPLPESWREQAVAPVAAASDIVAVYFVEPLGAAPSAGAEGSFGPWMVVLLLWAVGAAGFLAYHLIAHSRYTANLLRRARVDRTVAQGKVRVIETDAAHGPLAFGVFRKYVAFPRDFSERYDELERDLALAHELGHHVRGDLIANWVALFVLALHWFNPIAWKAFRAFRADQEMACDALVLAGRAQALRHAYGRAIVKSAHGGAVSAACHLHTINEVKGRLRMLSKTRQFSPTRAAAGLIGVGALSVAALGLTASGTSAAETLKAKVETVTGVTLDQDMPAPPAPPAPAAAPEAPEPPEAAEAPEAPSAPHKPHVYRFSTSEDGKKDGKKIRKMVIVRTDGSKDEIAMPDMPPIRVFAPDIRDGKCGKGEPTVEHRKNGDKNVMIICTDRIEAMSENATRLAMRHKAFGLESARMGLRMARRSIEAESDLSAEERARALKGIDAAEAELAKQRDAD
ncbi:M56 family metallopeptidase [Sphingomonas psychrotolerans]|uniref:M56 family metallopeptidase n=1 Tax=Sphingomonas psychrotolerans TaxID=1327635 RepID=A0ABU3N7R2_9SPHN|nr:M56 family metallopeptidase [Sphingomonas psychrotolerans]MDT8759380.1 M56 family metallopeptidase [Sphingomonas psychrotolerans]